MRLEPRFALADPGPAPEVRWVERANELTETLAPASWTTARVEAWLDWADALPSDSPPGAPDSLSKTTWSSVLAGGPGRQARRLAAWGLALGVFEDEAAAMTFAVELAAAYQAGVLAPGAQLPFGARVNPLAGDTAQAPPVSHPALGSRGFAAAASALRAGRGMASRLAPAQMSRLRTVAEAVARCEGDASACASPASNQALARETLRLTREKFDAGVSTSVEVSQAVDDVASSDLDYITSLFAHNLAKLSLAREMGNAVQRLDDYLKVQ